MKFLDALRNLELKFTSGNSVPVERNTITAEEFGAIKKMSQNVLHNVTLIKYHAELILDQNKDDEEAKNIMSLCEDLITITSKCMWNNFLRTVC